MTAQSLRIYLDSKVHGANMGPTWVLSAPDGPHIGPMNFVIWVSFVENVDVLANGYTLQLYMI